jgi:hypothetical protein
LANELEAIGPANNIAVTTAIIAIAIIWVLFIYITHYNN